MSDQLARSRAKLEKYRQRLEMRDVVITPLDLKLTKDFAVNKIDAAELLAAAENFRSLGLRHVLPISAEHGTGVGDLLDEVFAALPPETVSTEPTEVMLTIEDEMAGLTDRALAGFDDAGRAAVVRALDRIRRNLSSDSSGVADPAGG